MQTVEGQTVEGQTVEGQTVEGELVNLLRTSTTVLTSL